MTEAGKHQQDCRGKSCYVSGCHQSQNRTGYKRMQQAHEASHITECITTCISPRTTEND